MALRLFDRYGYIRKALPKDLSREELRAIHRAFTESDEEPRRAKWIMYGAIFVCGGVVLFAFRSWFLPRGVVPSRIEKWLLLLLCAPFLYLVHVYLYRPACASVLWKILRQRGHEVCPQCGCFLESTPVALRHCPQCGRERDPLSISET